MGNVLWQFLRRMLHALLHLREILVWLGLLWLLFNASAAENIHSFFEELFQLHVFERFWPIFVASWPIALVSATFFTLVAFALRNSPGNEFNLFWVLIIVGICGIPSMLLLIILEAITGGSPLDCTQSDVALACHLLNQPIEDKSGGVALGLIAHILVQNSIRFYGKTNFTLALGLGVAAATWIHLLYKRRRSSPAEDSK